MILEELLSKNEASSADLESYFSTVGLNNVTKRDLEKIINKFGLVIFKLYCFSEVYKIVLENETSRTMHRWTFVIGIMTVLYTIMTFLMLIK
jgi:hypothetical protein